MHSLFELTFLYATNSLGPDLIDFSRHANKKTITEADVKLVARKNPAGLLDRLHAFCKKQEQQVHGKNTGSNNANAKKRGKLCSATGVVDLQARSKRSMLARTEGDDRSNDDDIKMHNDDWSVDVC